MIILPPKVSWEQAASLHPPANLLITASDNRSTVFARWYHCVSPSNTRFLGTIPLTIPNGGLIGSAVFAQLMLLFPYLRYIVPHHFPNILSSPLKEQVLHLIHSFGPTITLLQATSRSIIIGVTLNSFLHIG